MSYVSQILDALNECGPMTLPQLVAYLDLPKGTVSGTLNRMLKATRRRDKLVYIRRWDESDGDIKRTIAVYAIGNKRNCSKPRYDHSVVWLRWYRKRRTKRVTASVFNLAMPNAGRIAESQL